MNAQKSYFFNTVSKSVEVESSLPVSINLAQRNVVSSTATDIYGEQANGVLTYHVDINEDCIGNFTTLKKLCTDYLRPGIRRSMLFNLFYVYEIPDYGAQALTPNYIDFAIACYTDSGLKINHNRVGMLRSYTTNKAYILIDKQIHKNDTDLNLDTIICRVAYKLKNTNNYIFELEKKGDKYVYDFGNNVAEISLLSDNKHNYCFYIDNGNGEITPIINSFKFNLVNIDNKTYDTYGILTEPQSGTMLDYVVDENNTSLSKITFYDSDSVEDAGEENTTIGDVSNFIIEDTDTFKVLLPTTKDYIKNKDSYGDLTFENGIDFEIKEFVIPDYFRQLFDDGKKSDDIDYSPDTFDRYMIEIDPMIDIPDRAKLYLGTRLLADEAFFDSSGKLNKGIPVLTFSQSFATKYDYDYADNTKTTYLYNSMADFEVYKFDNKESGTGIKIAVEDDELYKENKESKLFAGETISGCEYEIVPRYDNDLFYSYITSGSYKKEDCLKSIKPYGYRDESDNKIYSEYMFTEGCLRTYIPKDSDLTKGAELCFHIDYDDCED